MAVVFLFDELEDKESEATCCCCFVSSKDASGEGGILLVGVTDKVVKVLRFSRAACISLEVKC